MITRALILAAGKGVNIGDPDLPNCLTPVGGRPLLDRTLALLDAVGIQKIGIVVGYAGAAIRRHLADDVKAGRRVTFFENAEWDGPNGLSVLAARAFVTERTLLVMSDQIAAPALLRELCALPRGQRSHGAGRRSGPGPGLRHR